MRKELSANSEDELLELQVRVCAGLRELLIVQVLGA